MTKADFKNGALKNLAALAAGGQDLALAWLRQAPETGPVSLAEAATGEIVVLAGGQSQASRRDPKAEARAWLAADPAGFMTGRPAGPEPGPPLVLFGFGQPWAVRLLLDAGRRVAVFEPDPLVALAVLSCHDFRAELAAARLRLLTPWHLADSDDHPFKGEPRPALLVNPAARRRAPAQLAQLARRLAAGPADFPAGGGGGRPGGGSVGPVGPVTAAGPRG